MIIRHDCSDRQSLVDPCRWPAITSFCRLDSSNLWVEDHERVCPAGGGALRNADRYAGDFELQIGI
jgi:hypothetical protein